MTTVQLESFLVGEPLPGPVYVYVDFRFITLRGEGDAVDRTTYDRLTLKKLDHLFIQEPDRPKFEAWFKTREEEIVKIVPQDIGLNAAREDAKRKTMDIFQSANPNKAVTAAIEVSKKVVDEIMKNPYASRSLEQLQTYSKGTVDHSVNVSVLSTYLAQQMGYSHAVILQNIAAGALMHDIGKVKVEILDSDTPAMLEEKMKSHPELGAAMLAEMPDVPNEVKMIVAQHHECHDGSGWPKHLRGNAIYDLTRIVSIANQFDELVADGKGPLAVRQKAALNVLDSKLAMKFDPQKLDKVLKLLRKGL